MERPKDRPARIRELRRQGRKVTEIADLLNVSRVTVWRACKDMEPVEAPVAPTRAVERREEDDGVIDWPSAQGRAVDVLRSQTEAGSVSAASQLARLAGAELRQIPPCTDHVSLDVLHDLMQQQVNVFHEHLLGVFVRRVSLLCEVPIDMLEDELHRVFEGITDEMNARREAAIARQRSKE